MLLLVLFCNLYSPITLSSKIQNPKSKIQIQNPKVKQSRSSFQFFQKPIVKGDGSRFGACGWVCFPWFILSVYLVPCLTFLLSRRGTGYIGSFTTLALLEAGYKVVIADSLYNSSEEVINRIELICGKRPDFYKLNITDDGAFDKVFQEHPDIDSVIHFAALKVCHGYMAWSTTNELLLISNRLWGSLQRSLSNTTTPMSTGQSAF